MRTIVTNYITISRHVAHDGCKSGFINHFYQSENISTNILMIRVIAPFLSEDVGAILAKAKRPIIIENNYTSQMARLIRMETGFNIKDRVLKYDGEPFPAGLAYEQVKKILSKKNHAAEAGDVLRVGAAV